MGETSPLPNFQAPGLGQVQKITHDQEMRKAVEGNEYVVEVPRHNDVMMMLNTAPQTAQIIRRMTPHLLVVNGKGRFITGDAPIALWDTDEERRRSGLVGVGWMTPEVEVTIPLTANCCLVLNWDGQPEVLPASDLIVANCNNLRAYLTRQFLFASHGDVPLLRPDGIVWGEDRFIEAYSEKKQTQPAIEIRGGTIPRRPPENVR